MPTSTVSPAALAALTSATATATSVRLNTPQLPRLVYEEVDTILRRIGGGGAWLRRDAVHVFPRDPRTELAATIATGLLPADGSRTTENRVASFFRTPEDVAVRMADLAFIGHGQAVLEPSAGDGVISRAVRALGRGITLTCVEVDEQRAALLHAAGFNTYRTTFQEFARSPAAGRYDAIVMHPPFTELSDRLAWLTHVELALTLLRAGGRLVALVPHSFTFRPGPRFSALRELVGDDCTVLPDDTFTPEGTSVRTVLIEIQSDCEEHPPVLAAGPLAGAFRLSAVPDSGVRR